MQKDENIWKKRFGDVSEEIPASIADPEFDKIIASYQGDLCRAGYLNGDGSVRGIGLAGEDFR